ncbi:MAG: caspase family protein [Candidatus Latescibacteria bacterium]|nr:caspase family protein [Candidatus Latescibacterota bacterium]
MNGILESMRKMSVERGWIMEYYEDEAMERMKRAIRDAFGEIGAEVTTLALDKDGPEIIILQPLLSARGISVVPKDYRVTVIGEAKDKSGVAYVKVNGKDSALEPIQGGARFSASIILAVGENDVMLEAMDTHENRSRYSFRIMRKTEGVALPKPGPAVSLPCLWAVVVGISDYSDPRIPDLKYADADAKGFYSFLKQQKEKGVFKKIRTEYLLNQEATLRNLKSALGDLVDARTDDIVLIYFAGHGMTDKVGKPYLLTYDSNIDELYATAMPMSEFNNLLKDRIHSERTLILADACHSGGIGTEFRGTADIYSQFYNLIKTEKGKAILTASRAKELSKEDKTLGHGVFTYYLLKGLQGEADTDQDGIITLSELYDYVYDEVRSCTNGAQHPELKGNYDNRMPLSVVK